ncbi:NUDIX hydrolase [Nonomuraea aurantiaca]|uniref:NUDIX hydrolase n=1 Tax=Nonomuraea aurantiaca TaxID=2878562 RepID=UPI001CD91BBA|nr:NUDIX hydrolase [Nonomuraea aurantiaca]MCA2222758.1 NUDIX hydrolase [Nonomuraea aurantiaca]
MRRSERLLYAANGVDLRVVDLELTDGGHVEQPFVRTPQAAGAVVFHAGRALLLWRHRPVTDTWGWEIPLGEIGPDEDPERAAARLVEQQTGWRPGPLMPLIRIRTAEDVADSDHVIFVAYQATPIAAPADDQTAPTGDQAHERERAEWLPVLGIQRLISEQAITSATTAAALLHLLADLLQARTSH